MVSLGRITIRHAHMVDKPPTGRWQTDARHSTSPPLSFASVAALRRLFSIQWWQMHAMVIVYAKSSIGRHTVHMMNSYSSYRGMHFHHFDRAVGHPILESINYAWFLDRIIMECLWQTLRAQQPPAFWWHTTLCERFIWTRTFDSTFRFPQTKFSITLVSYRPLRNVSHRKCNHNRILKCKAFVRQLSAERDAWTISLALRFQ